MEVVLKKQNDLKEKKMKADMKKVEAVNELVSLGLHAWLSKDEAQDYFCSINDEKMRCKVILAQLKFYRNVIDVKCPANLFNKSAKGIEKTSNELLESLFQVLEYNLIPSTNVCPPSSLKPKDDRNKAFADGKASLREEIQNARLKRFTSNQTQQLLPCLLEKPELLVGKNIRHLLNDDGVENWELGSVLSLEKQNKNVMRTTYSVLYCDDPDVPVSYPLLIDLKKGDLIIEGGLGD